MLKLFARLFFCLFISCCCTISVAEAQTRHPDYPLRTDWQWFRLGPEAAKQAGIGAHSLAVLFVEPDAGWYTYAHDPGGFAKPTRLSAMLEPSGEALRAAYPKGTPKQDAVDPSLLVNAYPDRTPLFLLLPKSAGAAPKLRANLELLLCAKDKCLPASLDLEYAPKASMLQADPQKQTWWPLFLEAVRLSAKTSANAAAPAGEAQPGSSAALPADQLQTSPPTGEETAPWASLKPRYLVPELEVRGLAKALLLGLLAGLVLNFMPCVLPVISIKLSALLAGSGEADEAARRHAFREHNLFFALGALLYFLCLSLVLGATEMAWGQIFQRPGVVLGLAMVIFALALSLLGVFSLPIVDLKLDQKTTHPKLQALFTGLLTTLLATPCSGPFLGGVLGWTLLQPPWVISCVLMAIGAGMASPYLFLCLFPGLVRKLPRPGPWTGHLERLVALFLFGTCIYLVSILPESRLISALVLLWLTGTACWLWGEAGPGFDTVKSALLKLCAIALVVLGLALLGPARPKAHWERFSTQELRQRLGKETVVVDFTADWCPSCKVLEQTTLSGGNLDRWKATYGFGMLQADLSGKNPEAEALLHALGSKSIPALAIFPKNSPDEPLVLRDLFTPAQFEEAIAARK